MAQTRYAMAQEPRDPMTAAMLSVVPGLGQFYNGESRKGILFLDVAIINYILLSIVLLAPLIVKGLHDIGAQFGMRVNSGLLEAMKQMQIGSPVSLIVLGMVFAFVAYAIRDAYDHALVKRRRAIYSDAILQMNEATSGSYIIHASIIVSLAVLALFFFIPKPLAKQIVEIEFLNTAPIVKPVVTPVKTNTMSTKTSEAKITKFDHSKPIQKTQPKADLAKQNPSETKTSTTQAKSQSAAESSSSARITPVRQLPADPARAMAPPLTETRPVLLAHVNPVAIPHLPAQSTATATAANLLKPLTSASTSATTLTSTPKIQPVNAGNASALPLPATVSHSNLAAGLPFPTIAPAGLSQAKTGPVMPLTGGGPSSSNQFKLPGTGAAVDLGSTGRTFSPKAGLPGALGNVGHSSTGAPSMLDIPTHQAGPGGPGGPNPEAMGRKHSDVPGHGDSDIPAPVKAPGRMKGDGDFGHVAVIPSGGPAQSGTGEKPNFNAKTGPSNVPTVGSPDFSKYMADLQRRIKRAWFPNKDQQSRHVKVMFKIHEDGTMSNLRISQSSNWAAADQAALQAVNNAAPFAPLPRFSPENVDIEFTFDYNLFTGH